MSDIATLPRRKRKEATPTESSDVTIRKDVPVVNEDTSKLYSFSCVMIPIASDIAILMDEWNKKNIPDDALHIDPDTGMEGRETDPHVTILYGIHTSNPDDLNDILFSENPPSFTLNKVSLFTTNPEFDVVKIDIDKTPELMKLHDELVDNIEHTSKFPDYKPHATLAYVKKGTCSHLENNKDFIGMTSISDCIEFHNREGDVSEYYNDIDNDIDKSINGNK